MQAGIACNVFVPAHARGFSARAMLPLAWVLLFAFAAALAIAQDNGSPPRPVPGRAASQNQQAAESQEILVGVMARLGEQLPQPVQQFCQQHPTQAAVMLAVASLLLAQGENFL